jgi:hypothetical protein
MGTSLWRRVTLNLVHDGQSKGNASVNSGPMSTSVFRTSTGGRQTCPYPSGTSTGGNYRSHWAGSPGRIGHADERTHPSVVRTQGRQEKLPAGWIPQRRIDGPGEISGRHTTMVPWSSASGDVRQGGRR